MESGGNRGIGGKSGGEMGAGAGQAGVETGQAGKRAGQAAAASAPQADQGGRRTLILGAAGFIGTNLTLELLRRGTPLTLFDRPQAVYPPDVRQAVADGRAQLVEGDFSARAFRGEHLADRLGLSEVDTVFHLVSTTCPTNSNREVARELEENVISTVCLLDACAQAGIGRMVFLSSGGTVYGRRGRGERCREEEETFPITAYGIHKLTIEKLLFLYREMYGMEYRVVRLSNPYGPYQRPDGVQGVVTTFLWRALRDLPIEVFGDGSVIRDYLYIGDAVDGLLRIAAGEGRWRLYNLGCGKGESVREVVDAIQDVLGKRLQVRYLPGRAVDVPFNVLETGRFLRDFGPFEPIPLREGIRRTAAFLRGAANLQTGYGESPKGAGGTA